MDRVMQGAAEVMAETRARLRQLVTTNSEASAAATLLGALAGYEVLQMAKMALNEDEQEVLTQASDMIVGLLADLLKPRVDFSERT